MDSDDEILPFSSPEGVSPPVRERKLKRLKKAIRVSDPQIEQQSDVGSFMAEANSSHCENLNFEVVDELLVSSSGSEDLDEGNDLDSGFTGLGTEDNGLGAKRVLDFGNFSVGSGEYGVDRSNKTGDGSGDDASVEEPEKIQLDSECIVEQKDKKKRKKKDDSGEGNETDIKRMSEKKRREHLKQLHAESQRLLRETRDAKFKSAPLVQKPISSVLEKIRQRKLEVARKSASIRGMSFIDDSDSLSGDDFVHPSTEVIELDAREGDRAPATIDEGKVAGGTEAKGSIHGLQKDESNHSIANTRVTVSPQMVMNEESKQSQSFRAPNDDTQDLFSDSQTSDSKNETPSSPLEEAFVPSVLAMNLKFDSAPPDDVTSDEEEVDDDKENKWLEHQDATGTENLLQKLKYGSNLRGPSLIEEKEGMEDEESGDDDDDEASEELTPSNLVKMNLKKVKQMIPQMFTDSNDAYLSSDDDETEKRHAKQCLLEKAEQQVTFLSPAEDESSREVFCRIKKLNLVPDIKRRAKTNTHFDMSHMGVNRSLSSRSSFLSRGGSSNLPSSKKQGSTTARSFIFERDDSNSRSALTASEDASETDKQIQRENRPKVTSFKISNSQVKITKSSSSVKKQDTSLLDILKRTSMTSKRYKTDSVVTRTDSMLASFKLVKKPVKTNEDRTSPPLLNRAFVSCNTVLIQDESDDKTGSSFVLDPQLALLQRLDEIVRNLSEIVARLESKLPDSSERVLREDDNLVIEALKLEKGKNDLRKRKYEVKKSITEMEEEGAKGKIQDESRSGAVSVTKYSPFWSERFQFVSAVKLDSQATCINVLPFRDYEGLSKYVAVGDERGTVYVFLRNGDVLVQHHTLSESPITAMVSYLSIYKNESYVVTGHKDGIILIHRIWEGSSGEDWSSLLIENVGKFVSPDYDGGDGASITILEVHHAGRMKYILATDVRGKIWVFRENGTLYGSTTPNSRPLAFLKQRLLFLTESGAGSLDLRSMKVRESECEGLNHSLARNYVFDVMERSKAYGFTSEGDLIHVLLLGDIMNFKCRVRSKKKFDMNDPLALQAIKGYLLIVSEDKIFVHNVSSQHYVRVGAPRIIFSAGLDELRSSFLNYQNIESDEERNRVIPLIASDREKFIVVGLGGGYVGMYRSNLPVYKGEFNTIFWTSPVLFFVLFLFGAWQFFAKKKEALTSWGPDDPFSSTSTAAGATTGAPLGTTSSGDRVDRSFIDSSSRNNDMMELRGSGLRGPTR
ncbi:hypothetical protein F8388_015066, partial [Cannabis sativa]